VLVSNTAYYVPVSYLLIVGVRLRKGRKFMQEMSESKRLRERVLVSVSGNDGAFYLFLQKQKKADRERD
jgi:hypothetical protein